MEAGLPASGLFANTLALAPLDLSVRQGRAAALFAEGNAGQAIDELDEHLQRVPGWLAGHVTVARLRWMSGDRERFAASFDRALRVAPKEAALWLQLAATLMEASLHDRAIDTIARARAAAGPNPAFDATEAACLTEKGEIEAAERLFVRLGRRGTLNQRRPARGICSRPAGRRRPARSPRRGRAATPAISSGPMRLWPGG
jgi:predicted Zn-dependent protease